MKYYKVGEFVDCIQANGQLVNGVIVCVHKGHYEVNVFLDDKWRLNEFGMHRVFLSRSHFENTIDEMRLI